MILDDHESTQRRITRMPLGCDYQGRHPEAAHPCTDIGADDDRLSCTAQETAIFWVVVIIGTAATLSVIALALWGMP